MIATTRGYTQVVEILMKYSSEVNLQDEKGLTNLMITCRNGHVNITKLLLANLADVNLQDCQGRTALMHSVTCVVPEGNDVIIDMLFEKGAKIELQDEDKKSALVLALECHSAPNHAYKLLSHYERLKTLGELPNGDSALITAVKCNCSKPNFIRLTEMGTEKDIQNNDGMTALMVACEQRDPFNAGRLIACGAQLDLQDRGGKTALMIACQKGHKYIVSLLLKRYARVDIQDNRGWSALMIACEIGWFSIAKKLLEFQTKFHLNLRNNVGQTALVIACSKGHLDIVKLLLQNGDKQDLLDCNQRSALMHASEHGHIDVAKLLLDYGACVDLQDSQGYTALMIACQIQHSGICQLLLDRGANIRLRNNKDLTALKIAMTSKIIDTVSALSKITSDPALPGILFSEDAKKVTLLSEKKTLNIDSVGISLSIPEDALPSTDPPLDMQVQPCFSGPFEVPQDLELVSPVYIVKPSREVKFRKAVLVKIWHYANLETEEDCEDMVFLSASTTPEYRGTRPVYVFREIRGVKGLFRPGEEQPVGEIALKHFCGLAVGRRKRQHEDDSEETEPKCKKGAL